MESSIASGTQRSRRRGDDTVRRSQVESNDWYNQLYEEIKQLAATPSGDLKPKQTTVVDLNEPPKETIQNTHTNRTERPRQRDPQVRKNIWQIREAEERASKIEEIKFETRQTRGETPPAQETKTQQEQPKEELLTLKPAENKSEQRETRSRGRDIKSRGQEPKEEKEVNEEIQVEDFEDQETKPRELSVEKEMLESRLTARERSSENLRSINRYPQRLSPTRLTIGHDAEEEQVFNLKPVVSYTKEEEKKSSPVKKQESEDELQEYENDAEDDQKDNALVEDTDEYRDPREETDDKQGTSNIRQDEQGEEEEEYQQEEDEYEEEYEQDEDAQEGQEEQEEHQEEGDKGKETEDENNSPNHRRSKMILDRLQRLFQGFEEADDQDTNSESKIREVSEEQEEGDRTNASKDSLFRPVNNALV